MDIQINKDLRKFESKDIGPFSFRQIIFVVIALVCMGISLFIQKYFYNTWALLITVIPGVPVLVLGFLTIQGMSLIDYIKQVFPERFLVPKTLKWESDFEYTAQTAKELYGEDFEEIHFIKAVDVAKTVQKKKKKRKKK